MSTGTRVAPLAALVVASASWASTNVFAKAGLAHLPAMTLLLVQLVAATVVLWAFALARGVRRPPRLRLVVVMGLLEPAVAYAAVNLGLSRVGASDASLLAGTETVFVVLLVWLLLHQRPSTRTLVAVGIAVAGVMAITGSAPSTDAMLGNALVLLGALSAAGYVVLASRVAVSVDALSLTAFQFLFGTLGSLPFVAAQWSMDGGLVRSSVPAAGWVWASLAGIGLAVGFLLYNHAIARVTATTAGISLTLIPLFGFAGGVILLDESVRPLQMLGAVLILVGLVSYATRADEPAVTSTTPA